MFDKPRSLMTGKAKLEPSIDEDYSASHSIVRSEKLDESPAREEQAPQDSGGNAARHSAMIGSSIHIKGDITGDEDLLIEGTIDGAVNFNDKLVTVGQSGQVNANISARIIRVEGQMTGDMIGTDKVIIAATGHAHGNIVAPRITMEDGAQFKGNVNMEAPVAHKVEAAAETKKDTTSDSKRSNVVDASSMSARAVVAGRKGNNDEQLEQALMKARTSGKSSK